MSGLPRAHERQEWFRDAEKQLGRLAEPDLIAGFLTGKYQYYEFDLWKAFYQEWINAGRKTHDEYTSKSQPSISVALRDHFVREILKEKPELVENGDIAEILEEKYGCYEYSSWIRFIRENRTRFGLPSAPIKTTPVKPPRHSIGSASKDTATRTKSSRTSVSSPVAAKKHPTEEGHREKRRRVEPGARNDTPLTAQSSASQVIPIIDRQQAGKDFTISQLKQILASREHLLEDHEFMEHDFAEHLHREYPQTTVAFWILRLAAWKGKTGIFTTAS